MFIVHQQVKAIVKIPKITYERNGLIMDQDHCTGRTHLWVWSLSASEPPVDPRILPGLQSWRYLTRLIFIQAELFQKVQPGTTSPDNVTFHTWYFSLLSHWQISWIQNFTPQKHWKTPKNTRIWKNLHLAICFAQTLSVACVTNMRYASHLLAAAHLAPNWGHNSSSAQPLPHLDRLYYTA